MVCMIARRCKAVLLTATLCNVLQHLLLLHVRHPEYNHFVILGH